MSKFTATSPSTAFSNQLTDGLIWGKSIVFSNNPSHCGLTLPEVENDNENEDEEESYNEVPNYIINYSQLYQEFVIDNPHSRNKYAKSLIAPHLIQTGDILQTGDYRGVGSYYAVWLCAGVFSNPDSLRAENIRKAARVEEVDENEEGEGDKEDKEEEEEEEEDLLAPYQLSKDTILALKKVLLKWDCNDSDLRPILESTAPELLAKFPNKELRSFILDYRVEGHSGASTGTPVDWDSLSPEDLANQDSEGFVTYGAQGYFQGVPDMKYPLLKSRRALSNALRQRPWMELYLFEHVDEMGYAAPTAVSMAPLGYFSAEYHDRFIDLALLPPPLDKQTCFGYVFNNIRDRLPLEKGEDEGDEEEEEEQPKMLKKDAAATDRPDIAFVDFEGEDGIFWSTIETCGSSTIFTKPNPMEVTREMFRKHAQIIREKLVALHSSTEAVSEAELQALFDQLLWN